MQRVRISVFRGSAGSGGDTFVVYGDGGTGVMNYEEPLTPMPVALWPGAAAHPGHLGGRHLVTGHLDTAGRDAHLEGLHLYGEHLRPSAAVVFDTDGYVFGAFAHQVFLADSEGNVAAAGSPVRVTVINSRPPAPEDVRLEEYQGASDQVVFTFSPGM